MSDIFISYSKADHALALKLSAFLEAEGWSVWWDKSLAAADLYRDEIMKQLAGARAVITIWSPNSIKSDWVRAEAGRAKAEGKLIPVKTTDVAYADIPLPFGEMHTENISSTELIRAVVVAQLAKPTVTPSTFWQITGAFKYNVLTWIGIVGSVISLFAGVSVVLELANWARELVQHWHEWNQMIWGWVFSLIKIRVPKPFVPTISFFVSFGILVAGVSLSARTVKSAVQVQHCPSVARKVRILGGGVLVFLIALVTLVPLVLIIVKGIIGFVPVETMCSFLIWAGGVDDQEAMQRVLRSFFTWIFGGVWSIVWFGIPVGYLLYFSKERLLVAVNSLLFMIMSFCLLYLPMDRLPYVAADVNFELIDLAGR